MGCDIHLCVEVRRDGQWQRAFPPKVLQDAYLADWDSEWAKKRAPVTWYDMRNYDVFAILGNVRNGYGFAGVKTGDGFVPISDNRGIPDNASPEVQAIFSDYSEDRGENDIWGGDHSHSWVTLAELLAYDWDAGIGKRGVITLAQFAERVAKGETGCPQSYSGGVGGKDVIVLEESEARDALSDHGIAIALPASPYVSITWGQTCAERAASFYTNIIPALKKLGAPEDVRLIFGFDS